MNIYKISQEVNNGYDTYDSAIVIAENEEDAKTIHPCYIYNKSFYDYEKKCFMDYYTNTNKTLIISVDNWVSNLDFIKVEYLGKAKEGSKRGLILGSFNAG